VKPWSDFSFCVAGAKQHLLWFLIFWFFVIKDKEHKGNPPACSTTPQAVALDQAKRNVSRHSA